MFEAKLATSTIILIHKFQNSVKKKVKISSRFKAGSAMISHRAACFIIILLFLKGAHPQHYAAASSIFPMKMP